MLELNPRNPEWFLSYPKDFIANDGLFKLIPGYPENPHYPPPYLHLICTRQAREHWQMVIQWSAHAFMRLAQDRAQRWRLYVELV
jgi:hypothetical protein